MDEQHTTTPTAPSRRRLSRLVSAGLIAGGLAVVGSAVTAAALPVPAESGAPVDWSAMPEGYTQEQYEAFWGAGYGVEDVEELAALWTTDATTAKARAGQLLLDGEPVPAPHPASAGPASAGADPASAGPDPASAGPDPASTDPADGAAAEVVGPISEEQAAAFFGAGLDWEDAVALADLWSTDQISAKARAGQLVLDGQPVPDAVAS